jgi:RNA polymerase sigma-70 factor (ECF subfamily)
MVRHREAVYRIARRRPDRPRRGRDPGRVRAAFAALRRYDPARPLRWWLARIALNKGRDWRRRQAVRRFLLGWRDDGKGRATPPIRHPRRSARQARADLARTAKAIEALPGSLREAIVLHAVEGMPQRDIADLLMFLKRQLKQGFTAQERSLRRCLEGLKRWIGER